ncbi:hypothetical protein K0M31_007592 [Melipona bicolor]|uniref:Uncharacterized protein n=1 Tax=Melipona bicolor TaxID=60889 RepID=A0AA40KVY5_9HYME|nr:hypothetical protein K0M31_007592 [Melipona bicolor]
MTDRLLGSRSVLPIGKINLVLASDGIRVRKWRDERRGRSDSDGHDGKNLGHGITWTLPPTGPLHRQSRRIRAELSACINALSCWHELLALNEVRVIHAFLCTEYKFRVFGSEDPVGEERKENAKFLVNWES